MSDDGARTFESEIASILSGSAFFADLTNRQLDSLARLFHIEDYPQESEIYALGQQAERFYVLVEGLVRFTIGHGNRHASGGEVIRSGQVFGWAALIEGAQRRIATAYCITPCKLLAADGTALMRAMDRDHSMGYNLMKQLTLLITGELTAFASG